MGKETFTNNNFVMQGFYFDTMIEINITYHSQKGEDILKNAFDLCKYYEILLSKTRKGSDVYNINVNGNNGVVIHPETLAIIRRSIYYSTLSNGNFDISIQPLLKLWNFKNEEKMIPENKQVERYLELVNYKNLLLNENEIICRKKGMAIDLGGIAKGYIANKIKEYLTSEGITSGIINLGGNVVCIGKKENGELYHIGIQKPFSERGEILKILKICDKSVVSSGIYERFFKKDDKVYHHIISPKTGFPFETDLMQVTIVSDDSMDGDALSTIALTLGEREGLQLINSIDGVDGVFVNMKNEITYTDNIELY